MYSIVAQLMIKQNLSPDRGQAPGVTRGLICERCMTFLPLRLKSIPVPHWSELNSNLDLVQLAGMILVMWTGGETVPMVNVMMGW